jgi:5,10-methylenetetrahydromethanopterin reductase
MRIGLMLNEPGPDSPDPIGNVTAVIAAAKDDGFSSIFMPQIFGLDTLTTFTAAGSRVENIELVAAVMPIYTRHPLAMAQQALTTQAAVGGRLTLGVGLSHGFIVEHMFGLPFSKPVRFMDEYLDALLPLLAERKADVAGEVVRMNAAISAPAPHSVPVMLAALAPRMLKLAGARTDGTILAWTGPATVRDHVAPIITSAAEAAGRPVPRIASMLPVCVTDDVPGARERAAKVFAHYGQLPSYRAMLDREGAATVGDVAIVGSRGEATDAIAAHAAIGVTDFVISEFGTPDENAVTREVVRSLTRELAAVSS